MMPTQKPARKKADYIQRQYLLKKLNRMKGEHWVDPIAHLIAWVKAQRVRAKKPGGL